MRRVCWLFAAVICCLLSGVSCAAGDSTAAKLLAEFKARSSPGYVTVKLDEFSSLVDGDSRPYAVCVFADSTQYRDSPKLELGKRLAQIGDASKAILRHQNAGEGPEDTFIVVRIVLEDSKVLFGRVGAQGLPYFSCIPSSFSVTPGKDIDLPGRLLMTPAPVEEWSTNEILDFIHVSTGIDVGEHQVEPRSPWLPLMVLFFLGNLGLFGYKFATSSLVHYMPLYICGSLCVYWFSLSGGMYNIIRGTPFVGVDRRSGQPIIFTPGQGQVGAEGFIMGTSAVTFGMLIAHFLFIVPTIEDPLRRRKTCYALLGAGFVLFNWITSTHLWKTGVSSRFFF